MRNKTGHWFSPLVSLVRKDFGRKLIALFFALLVYFSVSRELSEAQKISGVPVEVILPVELIDVEPTPHYVTVNVKGSKHDLANLNPASLRAEGKVFYNNFIAGQPYQLQLRPEDFRSWNGVRVTSVDPGDGKIMLNLQRRRTANVPVKPTFSGELAPNYERTSVRSIPSEVQVSGPEQTIRDLDWVTTRPIPLGETVTESFEYAAELVPPGGVTISPTRVTVQIEVARNYEMRTFSSLPVLLLTKPAKNGPKLNYELLDDNMLVEVTVSGLAPAVRKLRRTEVLPYLEVSQITDPGIYRIDVGCYLKGESLDVKKITPTQIKVKVTEEKTDNSAERNKDTGRETR